ncbi:MAG: RNA polymerase sigma factor [Candidatus Omnitrophica bacterium]|nr:RNA polymerase sigma factor [Candidatus Omnitrophota bacterium]
MIEIAEGLLIDKVKTGDDDAFQQLVSLHREKAFGLCYSIVGNVEDAKDVLQMALVKAYKGMGNFKKNASFYTWLYRILVNTARDFLRKKAREKTEVFEFAADVSLSPEKRIINAELKQLLDQAICTLSENQRISFIMRHVNGMKVNDIAQIIHCRPATVKVHIYRAVKNLKKQLTPYLTATG